MRIRFFWCQYRWKQNYTNNFNNGKFPGIQTEFKMTNTGYRKYPPTPNQNYITRLRLRRRLKITTMLHIFILKLKMVYQMHDENCSDT